jgi:hypothetical protein
MSSAMFVLMMVFFGTSVFLWLRNRSLKHRLAECYRAAAPVVNPEFGWPLAPDLQPDREQRQRDRQWEALTKEVA